MVDTSVLINLLHTGRLRLFCKLDLLELVVTPEVLDEITWPEQRRIVDESISSGFLREETLQGAESLRLYAKLRDSMGKGEAASLALAKKRRWLIASDEKGAFRRAAVEQLGEAKVLTTPDLYLIGIEAGRLSTVEADQDKALLEAHRFQMPFSSFADLTVGRSRTQTRR